MKLTILGCNGPYPAQDGACSGYLLASESGDTRLLIDFGSGALSALPAFCDYRDLSAAILTHLHYDHMSDMLPLRYAYQFNERPQPLDVFAPSTPEDVASSLKAPVFALREMKDAQIGEFTVAFLRVRHPVEAYAVRVTEGDKVFVFTGDTNECPGLSDFCRDADLLMADAGLVETDWSYEKPHLSALRCAYLARIADAKRLLLTHFNPKNDPALLLAEALSAFEQTAIAVPGRTFVI